MHLDLQVVNTIYIMFILYNWFKNILVIQNKMICARKMLVIHLINSQLFYIKNKTVNKKIIVFLASYYPKFKSKISMQLAIKKKDGNY